VSREGQGGSLSGAYYRRRWGTEAQRTHWREGDAGHHAAPDGPTGETLRSPTVTPKLQRIAAQATHDRRRVFTTLAHLIDEDFLREAYRQTRQASAPGIDGVTAQTYAEPLDENLGDLHERLRRGRYPAAPVERVWIEKEGGGQRPIGKPTFEDKIVPRAVALLLEAISEPDFSTAPMAFGRVAALMRRSTHCVSSACKRALAGSWPQMSVETSTVSTGLACARYGASGSMMGG
jgi:hypothetical protein